jgi:hypothetical protein
MNGEVIGAIISAAASIVVAIIGRIGNEKSAGTGEHSSRSGLVVRPWMMTIAVLSLWFLAAAFIWPQFAGHNFLLIPPAMVALVLVRPIPPFGAALVTVSLFGCNVIAVLASNRFAHKMDPQPVIHSLPTFLLFACGWALLAYLLSVWRSKVTITRAVQAPRPVLAAPKRANSIATDLQKLAQLYRSGNLSTGEFSCAKATILRRARRHRVVARRRTELAI